MKTKKAEMNDSETWGTCLYMLTIVASIDTAKDEIDRFEAWQCMDGFIDGLAEIGLTLPEQA